MKALAFLFKMCRCISAEWKYKIGEVKDQELGLAKNPPFILYCLRLAFAFLSLLSGAQWIARTRKHRAMIEKNDLRPYRSIEKYAIGWLAFEFVPLAYLFIASVELVVFFVLIILLCYRLFDIFQSWVNQFMLAANFDAKNVNRSLVLAFLNYVEITLIGAIIRYRFQQPISFDKSLYGSVTAMIANPVQGSSVIQYAQLMFAVLFATIVVQHLVNRLR